MGVGAAVASRKICEGGGRYRNSASKDLARSLGSASNRVRCPEQKRAAILDDVASQRERAQERHSASRADVERLVGRLVNLSQIYPEMSPYLHGGYRLFASRKGFAPWRSSGEDIQLAPRARRTRDWLELLDFAEATLRDNDGVPLAPRALDSSSPRLAAAARSSQSPTPAATTAWAVTRSTRASRTPCGSSPSPGGAMTGYRACLPPGAAMA